MYAHTHTYIYMYDFCSYICARAWLDICVCMRTVYMYVRMQATQNEVETFALHICTRYLAHTLTDLGAVAGAFLSPYLVSDILFVAFELRPDVQVVCNLELPRYTPETVGPANPLAGRWADGRLGVDCADHAGTECAREGV